MEGEIQVRWRWGEGGGKPAGNSPSTRAIRVWAAEPGWGRSQALVRWGRAAGPQRSPVGAEAAAS